MDIDPQHRFSGPVTVFRNRRLPERATPAGYAALIDAFAVDVPPPVRHRGKTSRLSAGRLANIHASPCARTGCRRASRVRPEIRRTRSNRSAPTLFLRRDRTRSRASRAPGRRATTPGGYGSFTNGCWGRRSISPMRGRAITFRSSTPTVNSPRKAPCRRVTGCATTCPALRLSARWSFEPSG